MRIAVIYLYDAACSKCVRQLSDLADVVNIYREKYIDSITFQAYASTDELFVHTHQEAKKPALPALILADFDKMNPYLASGILKIVPNAGFVTKDALRDYLQELGFERQYRYTVDVVIDGFEKRIKQPINGWLIATGIFLIGIAGLAYYYRKQLFGK